MGLKFYNILSFFLNYEHRKFASKNRRVGRPQVGHSVSPFVTQFDAQSPSRSKSQCLSPLLIEEASWKEDCSKDNLALFHERS